MQDFATPVNLRLLSSPHFAADQDTPMTRNSRLGSFLLLMFGGYVIAAPVARSSAEATSSQQPQQQATRRTTASVVSATGKPPARPYKTGSDLLHAYLGGQAHTTGA